MSARTITFRHCWVNVAPGWTETVFHDGTRVAAMPEADDEYGRQAARLGYGDDLAAMSREHEILHTFLEEKRTGGASPTLWAVAHGQGEPFAPIWEQEIEEALVLAFQAFRNGLGASDDLWPLRAAGLDLEALRAEAVALLSDLP